MKKRPRVTLLYEDARGPQREFGLHKLIVASVWDRLEGKIERFRLEQAVENRCMKGVERVLAACRQDLEDLAGDGRQVAAIVDDDVIREKLKLPAAAAVSEVITQLRSQCPPGVGQRLRVFVIHRNTETILQAIQRCAVERGLELLSAETVQRALRKDLLARDQLFFRAAQQDQTTIRQCVLNRVSSLAELVGWLAELCGDLPTIDSTLPSPG